MVSFPVKDNSILSVEQYKLEGRAVKEYWSGSNFAVTPPVVVAGASNSISGASGVVCPPGFKILINEITATLSGAGQIEAVINVDVTSSWYSYVGHTTINNLIGANRLSPVFGPNGGQYDYDNLITLRENSSLSFNSKSIDTAGENISYGVGGVQVPDEPHTDAKYTISVFGDSNNYGANMGVDSFSRAYLGENMGYRVFSNLCRANGLDTQIYANKAEDGRTMLESLYYLKTGLYKPTSFINIVSFGTNDAASAKYSLSSEAKVKETVMTWINEKNKYDPDNWLIFEGAPLSDDPDRIGSSRLDNVRSWIASVANDPEYGGVANKVLYLDQSTIIPLIPANYKNSETTGGRVHLSGVGQTIKGNALYELTKTTIFKK